MGTQRADHNWSIGHGMACYIQYFVLTRSLKNIIFLMSADLGRIYINKIAQIFYKAWKMFITLFHKMFELVNYFGTYLSNKLKSSSVFNDFSHPYQWMPYSGGHSITSRSLSLSFWHFKKFFHLNHYGLLVMNSFKFPNITSPPLTCLCIHSLNNYLLGSQNLPETVQIFF